MTIELKPCPFCGGAARFYHDHPAYENRMFIGCTECNAEVEPLDSVKHSKSDQVFLWNTRAAPDVQELVRYDLACDFDGKRYPYIIEVELGDYVHYDQVAAIITAERQSAVAAEAKLAEYEKQEPIGVIHQGVFYSTKDLEEYPEYSTGIKIYASPAPMEGEN